VAELWLRSRRAAAGIPPAAHTDDEVRAWFREVVLPSRDVWVSARGSELRSMMVLDGLWVEQLYVAPEGLHQGYGSGLLQHAQSMRSRLELWAFEANTAARAFYERHGFSVTGPAVSDNEEGVPAVRYRWTRSPGLGSRARSHWRILRVLGASDPPAAVERRLLPSPSLLQLYPAARYV
jgi:GNAT superfamily N-acetyltransferase